MRTVTYNGDSAKVVIGNVGVFERGVPVELDDDVELNLDPDVWTVDPPFPPAVEVVESEAAARPRKAKNKETTNG